MGDCMQFRMSVVLWVALYTFFVNSGHDCHAAHRLKAGTLSISNERKLIVLGITPRMDGVSTDFNFEELGFEGNDLSHVDPKFLFEVTPDGIETVRSFDLQTLGDKEI